MDLQDNSISALVDAIDSMSFSIRMVGSVILGSIILGPFFIYGFLGIYDRMKRGVWHLSFDINKATRLLDKGEYIKAQDYCRKHLKNILKLFLHNWYLAISYYRLGQLNEAVPSFQKVLNLDPAWREDVALYLT